MTDTTKLPGRIPSWSELRAAMVKAVDLIDAKADLSEIKYALLQPWE